ncbi:MAG: hypothetical protein QXT14_08840 [Candidatus Bathyarchaeia archaeon]
MSFNKKEEPRQYFVDIFSLRLPGGLKYCIMCSWQGEIEATWSITGYKFSRKDSGRLAFLLRLLDFVEGG